MVNENPQNVTLQRLLQELSESLHYLICIIAGTSRRARVTIIWTYEWGRSTLFEEAQIRGIEIMCLDIHLALSFPKFVLVLFFFCISKTKKN